LIRSHQIAGTAAPKKKGSEAEAFATPIQDFAMLSILESNQENNRAAVVSTLSPSRNAAVWLNERVAASADQVFSEVVHLTPDLAAILLARNPDNRKLRQTKVLEFTKDIMNGDWKLNGEPVIVSSNGQLNDGQHRCAAVVECKTAIDVVVTFGVERETRDTLDQGTMRTAADYLDMHGSDDSKHLAAAARALWQYQRFGFVHMTSQKLSPTRSEVKRTALENPGLAKSLSFVDRRGVKNLSSRSILAFCHFAFRRVAGEAAANYFMDAFIEGADLDRRDPILYVRNRFIAEKRGLRTEHRIELLFRAWNAHRRGEQRTLFRVNGGELPMLEA
jgi:hypothetical protein